METPSEESVVKPEPAVKHTIPKAKKVKKEPVSWSVSKIFWGLLLIIIGTLIFLNNINVVNVNWLNLWRLWPLMIIAVGLSVLSLRNLFWKIFVTLLVFVTMGIIVWVAIGGYSYTQSIRKTETVVQKQVEGVKKAEIFIKAGASSLEINSFYQSEIAKSKLESNIATLSERSVVNGESQRVDLDMNANSGNYWFTGDFRSNLSIDITRNMPIKLDVETGASNSVIDVSKAQLTDINIKTGASNLVIKFGNKVANVTAKIDSGVSSITLQIPTDSGVRMKLDSGLTAKNLADLKDIGDDTYESSGYQAVKNKIDITSKVGVSSFTIERY